VPLRYNIIKYVAASRGAVTGFRLYVRRFGILDFPKPSVGGTGATFAGTKLLKYLKQSTGKNQEYHIKYSSGTSYIDAFDDSVCWL